jgi:acyl-[acyl carrier protein]--UDP-N-acetylglucosamine O-acyltransferase
MNKIHPTAILENVSLHGDNIVIGPYCVIGEFPKNDGPKRRTYPVVIKDSVKIASHVTIGAGENRSTTIEQGSLINTHCVIDPDVILPEETVLWPNTHVLISTYPLPEEKK